MTLTGTIQDGHVRLDTPCTLPNGTAVTCLTNEFESGHPTGPIRPDRILASIVAIHERVEKGDEEGLPAREFFDLLEREENESRVNS